MNEIKLEPGSELYNLAKTILDATGYLEHVKAILEHASRKHGLAQATFWDKFYEIYPEVKDDVKVINRDTMTVKDASADEIYKRAMEMMSQYWDVKGQ